LKIFLYSILIISIVFSGVFGYAYYQYDKRENKIAHALEFKNKAYLAYAKLAGGDFKNSKALYKEALNLYDKDPKTLRDYALCLSKLGENKEAVKIYEKSYQNDRFKNEQILSNLAFMSLKIKDYERSVQYHKELIERFRPKYKYIENLIISLNQLNQPDKTMGYYAYVMQREPEFFNGKFAKLASKYTKETKALNLLPKYENVENIDELLEIARDYRAKGYDKHALKAYYKIAYQTKTHDVVNKELADLLLKNYDIKNALPYLKFISKKDFDVLFKMGGIHHQKKAYKKAIALYEEALKQKETPMLLKNLTACSFYIKDKDRVSKYLTRLGEIDPKLAYNFEYVMLIKSGVEMTKKEKITYQLYNMWFDLKDSLWS
jgi:tetratricopeptide (TPR) repeat protein